MDDWLDDLSAAEQFWTTLAQVLSALVIALVLEGRKSSPEHVQDEEFLADIKERCDRQLAELSDRYVQATALIFATQLEVGAAQSPAEAVARTRSAVKEIGLSEQDPETSQLAEARRLVQARVSAARRRADSGLLAFGGRSAAPGIVIALLFLLPGNSPPPLLTLAALVACALSLLASLAVLAGRWDWLVRRFGAGS